jgi:hypothetical protein
MITVPTSCSYFSTDYGNTDAYFSCLCQFYTHTYGAPDDHYS